jgi:hypothetical protein
MKRILSLFVLAAAFTSCQEDLKSNNPGFQALKNDVMWKANDKRAYVSDSGQLTIKGLTQFEEVTLSTSSTAVGKYSLGTVNQNNIATYSLNLDGIVEQFATIAVPGPVSGINLVSGGTGYTTSTNSETTGGNGSGLMVATTVNNTGVITNVSIVSPGNDYKSGDIITIVGGNLNGRFRVNNVRNSNGEIEITEYNTSSMTISGKFKFNAANVNAPLSGQAVNFQYGEFYQVPIYPQE